MLKLCLVLLTFNLYCFGPTIICTVDLMLETKYRLYHRFTEGHIGWQMVQGVGNIYSPACSFTVFNETLHRPKDSFNMLKKVTIIEEPFWSCEKCPWIKKMVTLCSAAVCHPLKVQVSLTMTENWYCIAMVEEEKEKKRQLKTKQKRNWETCRHRQIVFPFIIYTMCLQVDLPWQNLIIDPQPLKNTNTYWQNRSELSVCKSKSLPVPLCVLVLAQVIPGADDCAAERRLCCASTCANKKSWPVVTGVFTLLQT